MTANRKLSDRLSLQFATGTIHFLEIKKASLILRALNHSLRQNILLLLEEHAELTVTEIYILLKLEQSVVSQHLAILRRAQIVSTIRSGKHISYKINAKRIREIKETITYLI